MSKTGHLEWQLGGLAIVIVLVTITMGVYASLRNKVDYQSIPLWTKQCDVELTSPSGKVMFRKTVFFTFSKGSAGPFAKIGFGSNRLIVCDIKGKVLLSEPLVKADSLEINSQKGGDPPDYIVNSYLTVLTASSAFLDGHRRAQYMLMIYAD